MGIAGIIAKLVGKNLIKFMKPVFKKIGKVSKFGGSTLIGGVLGRGLLGRVVGGLLGKVLGTGVFGGLLTGIVKMTKSVGMSEDQLAPQLSQAITKNEIKYYEKRIQEYVPPAKKIEDKQEVYNPFAGGTTTNITGSQSQQSVNNETVVEDDTDPVLEDLNFKLDQAKLTLKKQEEASSKLDLSKDGITNALGTVLSMLQVIPNLISTSIASVFGGGGKEEKEDVDEDEDEDEPESPEVQDEDTEENKSTIGSTTGGLAGSALGGLLGSIIPGFGTYIGSAAGYFIGDKLGSFYDDYVNKKNNSNKKESFNQQDNDQQLVYNNSNNNNVKPVNNQLNNKQNRIVEKQQDIQYDSLAEAMGKYKNSLDDNSNNNNVKPAVTENVTIVQMPTKETVIIKSDSITDKYK